MAFEKLMLIIDADGKGAIREVGNVAKSVDKLSASEKKLDRLAGGMVRFGAASAAAGAVAAVGLAKLAQSASNYGEALNKATVIAGKEGAKAFSDFAEGASKSAGLSKTAALDAAAGFSALGKLAGKTGPELNKFSIDLTQLAGDLASFNNTSVDEALQALKSGLQGETEPLKRFNIFLNDTALKQEYLAVTGEKVTGVLSAQQRVLAAQSLIFKQSADAQGDFGRTSDSLANRQRQLTADLENLKVSAGQGLLPIFEALAGGATRVVDAIGSLSPETQKLIGTFAGIGTGVLLAGGAFSFIIGQVIKMRDSFKTAVGAVGDLASKLRTLSGAQVALGGLATAMGAVVGYLAWMSQNSPGAAQSISRLQSALSEGEDSDRFRRTLADLRKEIDAIPDSLGDDIISELNALVSLGGGAGDYRSLNEVVGSLKELAAIDPSGAMAFVKVLREDIADGKIEFFDGDSKDAALKGLSQVETAAEDAAGQQKRLQAAAEESGSELGLSGDAAAKAGGGFDQMADDVKTASESYQEFLDILRAQTDPFFAVLDAADALADSQDGVAEAMKKVAEEGATPQNLRDLDAAQRSAVESGLGLQGTLGDLATKLQNNEISAADALATLDSLKQQFPELSGVVDAAKQQFVLLAESQGNIKPTVDTEVRAQVEQAIANIRRAGDTAVAVTRNPYVLQIQAQISGLSSVLSTINQIQSATAGAVSAIQSAANLRTAGIGGSDGNPLTPFALGGFLPGQAMIQPGRGRGLIQWAEAETGGEAFIPLGANKRKRSKQLWWETGKRLGVFQMADGGIRSYAAGGFSSDEPWAQYAEAMENAWRLMFDSSSLKQQVSLALKARDGYVKFSDEWVRFNSLLQSSKEQLARQNADLKDNEFEFNYERSTPQNQLLLAQQRLKGLTKFSDEWVRWTEEIERLQEDVKQTLTPSARASGGAVRSGGSSGGGSFTLQVNINGPTLAAPSELGRTLVGAIRAYEQQNGSTWRT
jgi:hypothetical protein